MAKKNQTPKVITRVKAGDFIRKAAELHGKGYSVLMPGDRSYYNMDGPGDITWADFIGAQLRAGTQQNGKMQRKQIPTLYFSSGNESMQGADGKGTEGLGWIEWGFGNNLPNLVALLTHMLPYTAAGIKFNADLCAGLGPQPMYDTTQYVGGNITQKFIRYKDAGQWLRGRIIDLQTQLLNLEQKQSAPNDEGEGTVGNGSPIAGAVSGRATTTPASDTFDALKTLRLPRRAWRRAQWTESA